MHVAERALISRQIRLHGLGQLPGYRSKSQIARYAVERLIENAASDPKAVENALGLLSFLEYLLNIRRKLVAIIDAIKAVQNEIANRPQDFPPGLANELREYRLLVDNIYSDIYDFFTEDVMISMDLVEKFFSWIDPTMSIAKSERPTTFTFIRDELLKQIPEKLGIRIVLERWKAPSPDMKSEQQFVVEDWAPPPGKQVDVFVVSEGSRTSLAEDAMDLEKVAPEVEAALKTIGVSLGAGPSAGVSRGMSALAKAARSAAGRAAAKNIAKRKTLLPFILGRIKSITPLGLVKWTSAVGASVGIGVALATAIPKMPPVVRDLVEAARRAASATKEGIETMVVIAGIALGIMLVGGAITFVLTRD